MARAEKNAAQPKRAVRYRKALLLLGTHGEQAI